MNAVFKVKKQFLDRTKILRFMNEKTRRAMNKYGGLLRITAQRSMRSRKGHSKPGEPPFAHGRRLLRKLLFYIYSDSTQTLVVGPVLLEGSDSGMKVPSLHEHGGTVSHRKKNGGTVTLIYEKREYMKPAYETTIAKLPEFFKE